MKKIFGFCLVFLFLGAGLGFAQWGEILREGLRTFNNAYETERARQQATSSSLMTGTYYPVGTSEARVEVTRNGNEYLFEFFAMDNRGNWLNPFDTKGTPDGNRLDVTIAYINQSACNTLGLSFNQGTRVGTWAGTYNIVNNSCFTDASGRAWQR